MCGWQVKLCDPLLHTAISERFRGAARRSAIQIHVYFTLLYFSKCIEYWITWDRLNESEIFAKKTLSLAMPRRSDSQQDTLLLNVQQHVYNSLQEGQLSQTESAHLTWLYRTVAV